MRLKFINLAVAVIAGGILTLGASRVIAQDKPTLMEYGADLVTNYVWRGIDIYEGAFAANNEDPSSFQVTPALQPSLTFIGPGRFSLNLWGSFALTDRDEEKADLGALDEIDYTLSYAWENKLGSFDTGFIVYTLPNPRAGDNVEEVYFSWGLPFAEAIGPSISHYAATGGASQYTALGFGGGEAVTWSANIGAAKNGVQDVTVSVGASFGDFAVAASVANRPKLELHDFDGTEDGKYTSVKDGQLKDLPSKIFWLTFSYGGSVTE